MITDPISDLLARIKNAYLAKKDEVVLPFSKIKFAIANILKDNGYLAAVKEVKEEGSLKKELKLKLSYKDKQPAMENIKRVSSPGRRIYTSAKDMPIVLSGYGIAIISTPKGIMTSKEAKKQNIGGEIICEVY